MCAEKRDPWETGKVIDFGGRTLRLVAIDAESRIDQVPKMTAEQLNEALALVGTQKTVKRAILSRLRRLAKAK